MISKRVKTIFSRKAKPASVVVPVFRTPFQAWVLDLPLTWMLASMVLAVSFVYIGTGTFAMLVLLFNIVFRLPLTFIDTLISKRTRFPSYKSIFILFVTCVLGVMYSAHLDEPAQSRAMPLVGALEYFKSENGTYPHTLDELMPRYLIELPQLKPVLSPPQFRYTPRSDGPPNLSFEGGGQFAHYLYDFGTKKWVFLD